MKQQERKIIALIACSKSKDNNGGVLPAHKRYTGQLFKAQLAYCRQFLGIPDQNIFVLSALYCVIDINTYIPNYNHSLTNMRDEAVREWGAEASNIINRKDAETVYILAGQSYQRYLNITNPKTEVIRPIPSHLGYAQQVQWLNSHLYCDRCHDGRTEATHVLVGDKYRLPQCDNHAMLCSHRQCASNAVLDDGGVLLCGKHKGVYDKSEYIIDFSEVPFPSHFGNGARTLPGWYVGDDHESGWKIIGVIHEDYYEWVNNFDAFHPDHGRVWGNFEETVYASSLSAYENFIKNHPYDEWDYYDV